MRTLKVGLLVAMFLAAFSSVAVAQGTTPDRICLSDTEVDQVLVPIALQKLESMVRLCTRKYPNLEREGSISYSEFNIKYSADIVASMISATRILLSRGVADAGIKQILQEAENIAIKIADAYDEKQCRNVVWATKALTAADSFGAVRTMAHVDFQSARASVPVCAPKSPGGPSASLDEQIKLHNAKVLEETKKRCLSRNIFGLSPLDAAIFEQKCRNLGIEPD